VAHNSKKWMVAYDGRIKRSRNRTKDDWYRDLKWWTPMDYKWSKGAPTFCPQCKHVQKYEPDQTHIDRAWKEARDEYFRLYGPDSGYGFNKVTGEWKGAPVYWKWMKSKNIPLRWDFAPDTFLCFKCERKSRIKDNRYYDHPHGEKTRYQYTRKQQYRDYRNDVKHKMRNEQYDDIGPYRKGWLD
jgi:hypothetical protein